MGDAEDALRERTRVKADLLELCDSEPEYRRPSLWELTKSPAVARQLGIAGFCTLVCILRPDFWGSLITVTLQLVFIRLTVKVERLKAYHDWCSLMKPWFHVREELEKEALERQIAASSDSKESRVPVKWRF